MIDIQFNKTCLIAINKELKIRQGALPILKNKEAALRAEARKIRQRVRELTRKIETKINEYEPIRRMWSEFPDLVSLKEIVWTEKKIASVQVKIAEDVTFTVKPFCVAGSPAWFHAGIDIIKEIMRLKIDLVSEQKLLDQIDYARRKTTQKVNLYEKVQIPFFEEATRKIKRYLEDEENLSKSSQKILKQRMVAVAA